MGVVEKVTQEDLILYEILRNPVLCTEFIYNVDRQEEDRIKPFEWDWYQKEFICDFNPFVSLCCGRAVGKSESIVGIITWILIFNVFPNDYIVYTVPNKVHLEPVWSKIMRTFRSNSFIKNMLDSKGGFNSSDFTVRLSNSAQLMCRIAGQSGTGANVIGLHTPFVLLDEDGYYPWGTYTEMQPILNTWTPGYRQLCSGVPTGLREKNICYHVDAEDDNYTKHRISSLQNPRFSEEDKQRALEQYGGEDSEDYIHLVLGQHGKPIYSLFDRSLMKFDTYPVFQLVIDGIKTSDIGDMFSKLELFPSIKEKNYGIVLGIDLGYTEPTAIIVQYLDGRDRLRFHGRIKLSKVPYPVQEKIIDALDTKFKPLIIGIDRGGAGIPLIQNMQDGPDYSHKKYKDRMYPVDFSSSIIIGKDSDGNENKVKAKPFFVSLLQEMSNNGRVVYSTTDMDMVTELERMTYSKNPSGDITYKTITDRGGKRGEDHFTSALLCGVGAYHMTAEFAVATPNIKLIKARWI
jgi:hypothetical protein